MISPIASQALDEILRYGNALLKFISPNDVGKTGSHQAGYYLPIRAWKTFTNNPPDKGLNSEEFVTIHWQDGRTTQSRIVWYGKAKNEYRLTRFGKDFPFLQHDNVGDLFVLVKVADKEFHGFVLDIDDDIEELQASLGLDIQGVWACYNPNDLYVIDSIESEKQCVARHFRSFCDAIEVFPTGRTFSDQTWSVLNKCTPGFSALNADKKLIQCLISEYELFRMAERKLCSADMRQLFETVDHFLKVANSILNRRKSRAGRALENHVEQLFSEASIPFKMRPGANVGRIDVIIPGELEYLNASFPIEKLFAVGIKTTCKDRWRQVLSEAQRVKFKHILTVQKGISESMLKQMDQAGITLIIPKPLLNQYPKNSGIKILTVEEFIAGVKQTLSN